MKNFIKLIGLFTLTIFMSFSNPNKKVLVIDVSHGGKDYGAVNQNLLEKDIVLEIAKKIKELNTNDDIEIILNREKDEFISLSDRAEFINKLSPDYVISLHLNSYVEEDKNGFEIIYGGNNLDSEELAKKLYENINFSKSEIKKIDFYLLKNVQAPMSFLELGYLSNQKDREYITSEKGQNEIAESILKTLE